MQCKLGEPLGTSAGTASSKQRAAAVVDLNLSVVGEAMEERER